MFRYAEHRGSNVWFPPKEQLCRGFENILIYVGDHVTSWWR